MKHIIILTVGILYSLTTLAQNNTGAPKNQNEFVQFVFTNLETRDQALEIDAFMRNQPGIIMSRADINSRKYLVIYDPSSGITETQITNWITDLEMEFTCLRHGIHGTDAIIDQKMDCE